MGKGIKGLNIQGNVLATYSNNGQFLVMKTGSQKIILITDGTKVAGEYYDAFGTVRSATVSDNGLILLSFDSLDTEQPISTVRIFKADNFNKEVYSEPWMEDFGAGLSITPDGKHIAIGSPKESLVYIYTLDTSGAIMKQTSKVIKGSALETFGSKVALSPSCKSVAIASPSVSVDYINVGAIFIFVLVGNEWEPLDNVLYGTGGVRAIGSGGVSVDDVGGMISVQDNSLLNKSTYMVSMCDCQLSLKKCHAFLCVMLTIGCHRTAYGKLHHCTDTTVSCFMSRFACEGCRDRGELF